MKRLIALTAIIAILCLALASCAGVTLDTYGDDVYYNGITYERSEFPNYNVELLSDHKEYIGDFVEVYDNGYEIPWEVFMLTEEGNVLYSYHALWLKPGYSLPDEYGEEFSKAAYVVSDGIMYEYTEEATPLITFEGAVTLADIIADEPTELADCTRHANIRLYYTNHLSVALSMSLCEAEGKFYLDRCEMDGSSRYYEIRPEYVEVLTAALPG